MLLDNKNTILKVHEWIAKYTKEAPEHYYIMGSFNLTETGT